MEQMSRLCGCHSILSLYNFTLSYNFSHGRKYETERKQLSNSDNDNGIR